MIRAILLLMALAGPVCAQEHRGGALRLLSRSAAGTLDPQVNYTAQYWQIFCVTHDGLVAFRKVAGPAGLDIVPDLADSVRQSADGLLFEFHLRQGVQFSDGAGLRAADVVASFRRIFKVRSPTAATFYGAILGADDCLKTPKTCALPGVTADGDTVSIRLTRPDAEFLTKLALPHASILEAGAPDTDAGTVPLPGTGPYRIESYDPNDRLVLVRNPYFRVWSADAQPEGYPDRIEYEFGLEDEAEVTAVENGQADWMFDTPPEDRLGELGARYAGQVHLNPSFAMWFVPLNVRLPPFDDVRVRQAFNLAVDREAVVKLFGGDRLAVASCQVLPPGLLGYERYCPYPHDLARARALVRASGTAGQSVTLVTDDSPVGRDIGIYLRDVLADLGFVARLRTLSGNIQFTYIQNTANKVQASLTNWYADYPSPGNFLLGVFGCAAFQPDSDSSPNISGFCDPALDEAVRRGLAERDAAAIAAVDRAITDLAPAVVLFNPSYIDVLSAGVGGYTYHEAFRWLIDQSWVR